MARFDGTADYLGIGASTDFSFGTGDWTVEFWVLNRDISTFGTPMMLGAHNAAGEILIQTHTNGTVHSECKNDSSATVSVYWPFMPLYEWHHVVLQYASGSFYGFLNGYASTVDNGSGGRTGSGSYGGNLAWNIGRRAENSNFLTGYLNNIRVSNTARYGTGTSTTTQNFIPPTESFTNDSNTKLLIQNGADGTQTFTDGSSGSHTITANGDVRWFAPKIGTGAMAFCGGASIAAGSGFKTTAVPFGGNRDMWRGSWTLEYWIRWNGTPSGTMWGCTTQGGTQEKIRSNPNSASEIHLNVQMNSGSSNQGTNFSLGSSMTVGNWYHFAYVCSSQHIASSGATEIEFFFDGTSKGTLTLSPVWTQGPSDFLAIGYENYETGNSIDGYIDEFLFTVGEVKYTSNFTPTTTAFEEKINVGLLLHGDEVDGTWAEDSSTGLAISTDSRMKFDGTGDYLSHTSGSVLTGISLGSLRLRGGSTVDSFGLTIKTFQRLVVL